MDAKELSVTLTVDKERTLVLDFNTLCEAEKVGGFNFLQDGGMPVSLVQMRAICYASWKKEDPLLTLEQTGLILQDHWPFVLEALTTAWLKAMPKPEDSDGDPTRETAATPPS